MLASIMTRAENAANLGKKSAYVFLPLGNLLGSEYFVDIL
jgi:hypothetical protein